MPVKKPATLLDPERKVAQAQERRQRLESYKAFRQSESFKTRSYSLIRVISAISCLLAGSAIPMYVFLGILFDPTWFITVIPLAIWVVTYGSAFFYVKPTTYNRIRNATYLMVAGGLIVEVSAQLLTGSVGSTLLGYLLLSILVALVGLEVREIIGVSVLCTAISGGVIFAEKTLKLYTPLINIGEQAFFQIFLMVSTSAVIVAGVAALARNLYNSLSDAEQRTRQFIQANQQLTQTNQFGKQVTSSLNSIVAELSANSRQQASGAQEQAAAVMEVTTSLTELGETARQIASNSSRVSMSASDGLSNAEGVREASERANTTAERGQIAVDSSIQAIEDVRNGITALAERLMILTERSKQISSIIALIKEIADETHLLALNAAIESAGAGESGRRFAVVASEVKSLADRSLEATTEVSQVINELQGAVASAVLASEETRKKTFGAVERSYQAGQVITELGQVVDETSSSSVQIVESVQQVATLAEEIRLATQQQESAIRQIISTMEGVGMVAQENASAVGQVSETVNRIDDLSNQLKEVLTTTAVIPIAA